MSDRIQGDEKAGVSVGISECTLLCIKGQDGGCMALLYGGRCMRSMYGLDIDRTAVEV